MDAQSIVAGIVTGAISGSGTVVVLVRSWVKRAEATFARVEAMDSQMKTLEARQDRSEKDIAEHTRRTEEGIQRLEGVLSGVASDVAYLKGLEDGSRERTRRTSRRR